MNKRKKLEVADVPDPPPEGEEEFEHGGAAKPISLAPLDFDTALSVLVGVKWPPTNKKLKGRSA